MLMESKGEISMIKELVMEVTSTLPDTATFDDILEAIYIRIKILEGIKDSQINKGLSTEELIKEIQLW